MSSKTLIVAEISANHQGSIDTAFKLIRAASDAGADAVKLQTFNPEEMVVDQHYTLKSGTWKGFKLIDLYRAAYTPRDWHKQLFDYSRSLGLIPFSTPFSKNDVDFLETLDCPMYKIASFELVDLDLIRYVATKGKPIIISTGMANLREISQAVEAAKGCKVTLLKCTSSYPAKPEDANLLSMEALKEFNCDIGLSDHTLGIGVAITAITLGATMIEKHLTLDRNSGGLDDSFSMTPQEFKQLVSECANSAHSLGKREWNCPEDKSLRRSLWFAKDHKIGDILNENSFITARPASGLHPEMLHKLKGKKMKHDVNKHTPVMKEQIE